MAKLPAEVPGHANLSGTQASILDLSDSELRAQVAGCDAVVSCLGHNLTFKGMYGPPRRLVTDATRRLCGAIESHKPEDPVKFVLMNTAGNRNRGANEQVSFGQRCILSLLRLLVPPHADNEDAAEYLRTKIGGHNRSSIPARPAA